MKIALIGDTHFGIRSSNPVFHQYFAKFYKFLFEYIDNNYITNIIQLGDLFDVRKQVNFLSLHEANKQFFDPCESRGIKMHIISGNHDCYYKNTNLVNSVRLLNKSFMTVIDTAPETYNIGGCDIDFYPWINENNLAESKLKADTSKSKYAVGHFEFAKFPMHPGQIAETGMDHKILHRYDRVFSGHYHCISRRDNVLYTGTPYEMDWADHNDPKGFWVLETETGELEFIRNPFRLHEKLIYDEDNDIIELDQIKDKYVKLIVVNKTNQRTFDAVISAIHAQQPYDLQIIDNDVSKAIESALNSNIELQTTNAMINHVVDSMITNLDKDKLKKAIAETYIEACELARI